MAVVEVLGLTEVQQVFVVSKHLYEERGSIEIVSPRFQDTDDSKEFSVIDVIISFYRDEGLG